jgi:tetratricopeptide (TPR) repeat protein
MPLVLTSGFIYNSTFPAWANTSILAAFISLGICIMYAISNFSKHKSSSLLTVLLVSVGILSAFVMAVLSDTQFSFALLGKGIYPWATVTYLSLFLVLAFSIELKGLVRKIAASTAVYAIVVTLINFVLIRYNFKVVQYTGYLSIPLISYGTLLNYAFIFSSTVLAGSGISLLIEKRGIIFTEIPKISKYVLSFAGILVMIWTANWVTRAIAAEYFISASNYAAKGDYINASKEIDTAISIAPFDVYYLGRIDLNRIATNQILEQKATNTEELQNKFMALITSQIDDAKKAVAYDDKNPQNYLALGRAYEQSIILTKDKGYDNAIDAYNKARAIVTDKDTVDTIKAKLSFGVAKETEGLGFLNQALLTNPSSTLALYTYSQYYASKQDVKSAVDYAEKAVISSPQNPDARMQLALLYSSQNRTNDAAQQFYAVVQLSPNNPVGYYYLALSFKQLGSTDDAKTVVTQMEKLFGKTKEIESLRTTVEEVIPAPVVTKTKTK